MRLGWLHGLGRGLLFCVSCPCTCSSTTTYTCIDSPGSAHEAIGPAGLAAMAPAVRLGLTSPNVAHELRPANGCIKLAGHLFRAHSSSSPALARPRLGLYGCASSRRPTCPTPPRPCFGPRMRRAALGRRHGRLPLDGASRRLSSRPDSSLHVSASSSAWSTHRR